MRQLKLPLEIAKLIDISDPVYTFCVQCIDIDPMLCTFDGKFNRTYGHYPKYQVADAGYGSYNNYLYCEEHGMEKHMKFPMYKKATTDES